MILETPTDTVTAPVRLQRSNGKSLLRVKRDGQRSALSTIRQEGASKILLPRQLSNAPFEAVLVNTSGGIAGGDDYQFSFHGEAATRTIITTQACEKCYRSLGARAKLDVSLTLKAGASLIWCPQESILFDGARLERRINIELDPDAQLFAMETVLFGRSASNEIFRFGELNDNWRIYVGGELVHSESISLTASNTCQLTTPSVLNGYSALSTMISINPPVGVQVEQLRHLAATLDKVHVGVSEWSIKDVPKIVLRLIAQDGYAMRQAISVMYSAFQTNSNLPRVWRV